MTPSLTRQAWALALLCAPLAAQQPDPARPRTPNVVLIVADDLGWGDIGWNNDEIRSPVLDGLARDGVRLDWHYVQPQCTPTRVALMTGRYPSRFADHCTTASNAQAFPIGTLTMAGMFKSRGYATCITGKWHLGSKLEWGPQHHGFDHCHGSLAGAVGMYDHRYRLKSPFVRTWQRNGTFVEQVGHATDLCTDEAVEWIDKSKGGPFFLYVPYHSVHVPLVEDQKWIKKNLHIKDPDRRLLAAAVTHLDACIGRIVKALDTAGVRDNTLLLFTSDNGGLRRHRGGAYPPPDPRLDVVSSNLPLRGWKTDVFEGGMRVPAFAHWKGVLRPGVSRQVMHAADWMPTLARLIGFAREKDIAWDGADVWDAVTDRDHTPRPRRLYWKWAKKLALRDGDWKLLRNGGKGPFKLFNLAEDAAEEQDLAAREPERLQRMKETLRREVAVDQKPMAF